MIKRNATNANGTPWKEVRKLFDEIDEACTQKLGKSKWKNMHEAEFNRNKRKLK
jgi:hypothetical protein